jgi:D-sedoheptulose 7-phosphate isomerase
MHKFEEILTRNESAETFASEYILHLSRLLSALDITAIAQVIGVLDTARKQGRMIFLCGNGGSAATASHLAEDLALGPKKRGQPSFRTISLTDSLSSITAIANDEGYENVFVSQLETLFSPGDVVIGVSASGNSPNVIRALEYASSHGGFSIGFTGFDGGKMREICHHCIHIASGSGEYEPVEDAHLIIGHLLASYFKYQPSVKNR